MVQERNAHSFDSAASADGAAGAVVDPLLALPLAVYRIDREGWIVAYNDRAVALWQRRPAPGTVRHCGGLGDGAGSPLKLITTALRERCAVPETPVILRGAEGAEVPVRLIVAPRADGGADVLLIDDRARAALAAQVENLRIFRQATLQFTGQNFWFADKEGAGIYDVGALFGGEDMSGDIWFRRLHPDDRQQVLAAWRDTLAMGKPMDIQMRMRRDSGEYRWVRSRASPIRDETGAIACWAGTTIDIDDLVSADADLRHAEERYRLAARISGDAIWDWDLETQQIQWNEGFSELFGYPAAAIEGASSWWIARIHPEDREAIVTDVRAAIAAGAPFWSAEYRFRCQDGHYVEVLDRGHVLVKNGKPSRMIGALVDLTERRRNEERIRWIARLDALTGLPNRHQFRDALDGLLAEEGDCPQPFAVVLIDLDEFKQINDTLGHPAGDAVLCDFADRMRQIVGSKGVAARLGGDEFAVLIDDVGSSADAEARVAALHAQLSEPFEYDGRPLQCGASIGASIFPLHGRNGEELLKHADIALYAAKAAGRGCHRLFRSEMRAELQLRASMVNLAREALGEDRVEPFYQPKVALATGTLIGFEALLRWRNARGEIQPPGRIAAAFEQIDLARSLSDRMIDRVVTDMRRWLDEGVAFGRVAINAADAEFRRPGFAERLLERLANAGVPPALLELEITETVFLGQGTSHVEPALRLLSAAGVRIALDDFGTGFASLSHLKRYPVDIIKIDQSFIRDIDSDADDAAIVRALITLGRSLGIEVVAEGVETAAQASFLMVERCEQAQGYLFGRPAPAAYVPAMTRSGRRCRTAA